MQPRRRKRSRFGSLPDAPPPKKTPVEPRVGQVQPRPADAKEASQPQTRFEPVTLIKPQSNANLNSPARPSSKPSVFGDSSSSEEDDDLPKARLPLRLASLNGQGDTDDHPLEIRPEQNGRDDMEIGTPTAEEPHADPLDAFMESLPDDPEARSQSSLPSSSRTPSPPGSPSAPSPKVRASHQKRVYTKVDHSKIAYPSFQKNLYVQVPALSRLTPEQTKDIRDSLQIQVLGHNAPPPIASWPQSGLPANVLSALSRHGYEEPTPVQAQALPAIMSGRDVIAVARTGSGKTLAFVLPLIRHIAILDRAAPGDGPGALIIAPTRELAVQILADCKKFTRGVGLRAVCAYGGSGVKEQIAELKRGADIVICTPGRMIDLLAMNSGRITNLRRVTFVVLDEADRMFDLGFGPQLTRIVENVRPDRQTVMVSATFPAAVERLARKVLTRPLEISVGGKSVAATSVRQFVEVRKEDSKFFRLLELLGVWYERGSTLVFVDRQDNADRIFRELSKARYKCLSLHGGLDQADRDSTILDFKNGDVKVLVATSVAARGLDVRNLTLVVNFDVPSHYEDYVHRVGRTGRAGRVGTAYTFITPEQDAFAADIVKALEVSARSTAEAAEKIDKDDIKCAGDKAAKDAVPEELRALADGFAKKRKEGIVKFGASSGYGGRGFTFEENEEYDAAKARLRKAQAKEYGLEEEEDESENENEEAREDDGIVQVKNAPKASAPVKDAEPEVSGPLSETDVKRMLNEAVRKAEMTADTQKLSTDARRALVAKAKVTVLSIASIQSQRPTNSGTKPQEDEESTAPRFAGELEINDYPQHARWQVTRKGSLADVEEFTGCVFTTRGNFYPPGRNPPSGERKLHFLIEGPSRDAVKTARRDIKQKLDEAAAVSRPGEEQYSKYSVV